MTAIANNHTPVKLKQEPDDYIDEWFNQGPTHQFAMSIGHNADLFEKAAYLLEIECVVLDR